MFETIKKDHTTEEVLAALSTLRILNIIKEEYELQQLIAKCLNDYQIAYQKEYWLAPHCRIDFLVNGGIGIEAKKGKPRKIQVITQLQRYSFSDDIKAMVLVVERNVDIPKKINGKPIHTLGLNKLWGIAI